MLLLCALGLQALPAGWLPAPPAEAAAPDAAYLEEVQALAAEGSWPWERIEALRATSAGRTAALAAWLPEQNSQAQKLCAVLGSGCEGALAFALFRVGVQTDDEALGVACLMAPAPPAAEWWPALMHAALARPRPLPVRAAAAARLLEAGCWGAWPVARSMLRSGTALDEPAPWADWPRAGRYELPKRLLGAALDIRLAQAGLPPSAFEPNAAWSAQEDRLRELEPQVQALRQTAPGPAVRDLPTWQALLQGAARGEPRATAVLSLLAGEALPLLRAALADPDPGKSWMARRALEERAQ